MLISLSAVEYKWYVYTATKKSAYTKHSAKGVELYIGKDQVFGVRILNDGSAMVKDMSDQKTIFRLSAKEIAALLEKSRTYRGKIKTETAPISTRVGNKDKDNLDAYTYNEYIADRGMSIVNSAGNTLGKVRKNDVFGLFSVNPEKGGWFFPERVEDIIVKKPVKIGPKTLSKLELLSRPLKKRPVEEVVVEEEEEEASPEQRGSSIRLPKSVKKPTVADLKPIHEKVNAIIAEVKRVGKMRIASMEDFKTATDDMHIVRDMMVAELKSSMRDAGISKEMGELLLKSIAAHWDATKQIIRLRKKSVVDEVADEVKPTPVKEDGDGNIVIDVTTKEDYDSVLTAAKVNLKEKLADLDIVINVEEIDLLQKDLQKIFAESLQKISEVGKAAGKTEKSVQKDIDALRETYVRYVEKFAARKAAMQEQLSDDKGADIDDGDDEQPEVTEEDYVPGDQVEEEEQAPEPVEEPAAPAPTPEPESDEEFDTIEFEEDEQPEPTAPTAEQEDEEDRPATKEEFDDMMDFLDRFDEEKEEKPTKTVKTDHLYDENENEDEEDYSFDSLDFDRTLGIEQPDIDTSED